MATDTLKSASQTPESKNPKKALTPTPTPTPTPTTTNEPNLTDKSKNPSSADTEEEQTEPELKLATVSSVEGTDQKELNDSKVKGTAVVSPTGDSGSANDIQKKLRRAERFGVPVQLSEEEKRNSRAERFGTGTVVGSEACKTAEEQKRKARAERFGLSVPVDDEAKKKARLARFGSDTKIDTVEEEKRKARAMRFSQPPSNNVPHTNHEEDVGQKTAIAGNATGGA